MELLPFGFTLFREILTSPVEPEASFIRKNLHPYEMELCHLPCMFSTFKLY